jgi:hypothetical protein
VNRRSLTVVAIVFLAFATVGIAVGVWFAQGLAGEANARHDAACEERFSTSCDSIPLDQLEEAFGVDLPDGTVVLRTSYQQFDNWTLEATFTVTNPTFELPALWNVAVPDSKGVSRVATLVDVGGETRTLTLRMTTS